MEEKKEIQSLVKHASKPECKQLGKSAGVSAAVASNTHTQTE